MERTWKRRTLAAAVCAATAASLAMNSASEAATSFSNSLTGFTGDSTQLATQTALANAGFDFYSIDGLDVEFTMNPAVLFNANGAAFGQAFINDGGGGDGGRNYMRTTQSDFASASYVAEVTIDVDLGVTGSALQQVFFGMGSGETALFGVPDWSTQWSSTFMTPEPGFLKSWSSNNDVNRWNDNDPQAAITGAGVHRMRMAFNAGARSMTYSIDLNYAGGAYAADYTAPVLDLNTVNCPEGCGGGTDANLFNEIDGWPTEPSKIFFGGDDGVKFRDFSVVVGSAANANFDGVNGVDGGDVVLWQRGLGITTGATLAQGDSNADGAVDAADLGNWVAQFGTGGSVGAVSAAPEPAAAGLLAGSVFAWTLLRRRYQHVARQ